MGCAGHFRDRVSVRCIQRNFGFIENVQKKDIVFLICKPFDAVLNPDRIEKITYYKNQTARPVAEVEIFHRFKEICRLA